VRFSRQSQAGDSYHLDKSGLTGLSQTGPSQEEEREGEKRQRHWIPKKETLIPNSNSTSGMPRYDPKWAPENDKNEWTITTLPITFLRV
jgi:hypothetical protein